MLLIGQLIRERKGVCVFLFDCELEKADRKLMLTNVALEEKTLVNSVVDEINSVMEVLETDLEPFFLDVVDEFGAASEKLDLDLAETRQKTIRVTYPAEAL